jgi:hypothetical protein
MWISMWISYGNYVGGKEGTPETWQKEKWKWLQMHLFSTSPIQVGAKNELARR